MKKRFCKDCVCLVENNGEWYCDELNEPIHKIEVCPEAMIKKEEK